MPKGYVGMGAEKEFAEEDRLKAAMKKKEEDRVEMEKLQKIQRDKKRLVTPFNIQY